ncbi:MAG: mechanosensitive ion channel family protein [Pseudomonadota bacterium]|nr:mechanosensitive ion channel family protein [Pseudomonadota bacterium]
MSALSPYFQISAEPRIWLLQLVAVLLLTLVLDLLCARALRRLRHGNGAAHSVWRHALLEAAALPVRLLIWLCGLSVALALVRQVHPALAWAHWLTVQRVLAALILTQFFMRLIGQLERDLTDPARTARPLDAESALAIGRLAQVATLTLGALMVLETLGFSLSGVLAFGGVGGIAIGFAAKDMLSNFFGGLMIYLDKPFSVGNWVRSPDRQIEGTVQDIGWRLTRIRTFEDRPLYVPNAVFNTIVLENVSRMQHFRIEQTVGLSYDDAARVPPVRAAIQAMLQAHPDIAQDQTLLVRLTGYGASTLNVLVYCFTKTTDWGRFMQVQEDVLLKIGDIVAQHGASFAFPTQTVYNIDADPATPAPAPVSPPGGT